MKIKEKLIREGFKTREEPEVLERGDTVLNVNLLKGFKDKHIKAVLDVSERRKKKRVKGEAK
jgi:hypothetical protein